MSAETYGVGIKRLTTRRSVEVHATPHRLIPDTLLTLSGARSTRRSVVSIGADRWGDHFYVCQSE